MSVSAVGQVRRVELVPGWRGHAVVELRVLLGAGVMEGLVDMIGGEWTVRVELEEVVVAAKGKGRRPRPGGQGRP